MGMLVEDVEPLEDPRHENAGRHSLHGIVPSGAGPGAGYVLAPRGNQESLNDDVRLFLNDPATPVAQASQTNKGHG